MLNVRLGVMALALVAAAGGCDRGGEGSPGAAPGGAQVEGAPAAAPVAAKGAVKAQAAAQAPAAKAVAQAPANAAAPAGDGHDCGGGCDEGGGCDGADKHPGGPPQGEGAPVEDVKVGDAPVRGPANAPVTVVVFSDFQCPYCVKAEATISELEKQYPGKLRVAYKNNPLPMHKNARLAAKAAIAADEQGKFWAYHDVLLANRHDLERPSLERFAGELGLRGGRFSASLDSKQAEARLQADVDEAARLQIVGTPTFFVNGRRVVGAQPAEVFRAIIDKELERAGRLPSAGPGGLRPDASGREGLSATGRAACRRGGPLPDSGAAFARAGTSVGAFDRGAVRARRSPPTPCHLRTRFMNPARRAASCARPSGACFLACWASPGARGPRALRRRPPRRRAKRRRRREGPCW